MARYIKANPKVAKFLNLESDRNTVKDGNYLLWQGDMLAFGPLTQLSDTLEQIGAIALLAHEAREEQDGTVTRPLPQATDERFVMPPTAEAEAAQEEAEGMGNIGNVADDDTTVAGDDTADGGEESQGESEQPETPAEESANESENEEETTTETA